MRVDRQKMALAIYLIVMGVIFISKLGWVMGSLSAGAAFGFLMMLLSGFRYLYFGKKYEAIGMSAGMVLVSLPFAYALFTSSQDVIQKVVILAVWCAFALFNAWVIHTTPIK